MADTSLQRIVKADLQNYLKIRSDMSKINFHELMDRTSDVLGPGGVLGITTFHDLRYEHALRQCKKKGLDPVNLGNAFYVPSHDILVVKCQRIMTQQGDLDVIGVRENHHLPERLSLEDTLKAVEDEGALCDVPAPFHKRGLGPFLQQHPHYLARIQAITVYSGEGDFWIPCLLPRGYTRSPNDLALDFYKTSKREYSHLGALTASNGSLVRHIGTNYSMIRMPEYYGDLHGPEDVVSALRATFPETSLLPSQRRSLRLGALRHQFVVLADHNPLSYALKGVPNAHLDRLFTKKE